jgi:hypothetical protein
MSPNGASGFSPVPTSGHPNTSQHMTKSELDTLIADLAEDFRPQVLKIEASIPTTKNHYGQYMSLLSQMAKDDKNLAMVFSLALVKAGANREGIKSALRILSP